MKYREYSDKELIDGILNIFAESGCKFISEPVKAYLAGKCDKEELIAVFEEGDKTCGKCGCGMELMYSRALGLKHLL